MPTLVGAMVMACAAEAPEPTGPNIVLVSIDSLRAANLGAYGYPRDTSPTIDALATGGLRFENALSTTSWTLPAHAAMFTGLYDSSHGVFDNGRRLADDLTTLAEILQGIGYETAGFFGGPYLHPVFGLGQGFDHYQSCMTRLEDGLPAAEVEHQAMRVDAPSHADITGPRTLEEVSRWMARGPQVPFFLFLHLWDVHYDYIPPAEYLELFDPDYTGDFTGENFTENAAIGPTMDRRDLEHLIARYDGEIRFTDTILGRILEVLAAASPGRSTLVVVTADHGEEFFEHGDKGHQRTLFDEVIRVPLVFNWPGHIPAGGVVHDQVRLIDLLPTLVRIAGYRGPLEVQGRDLGLLLAGGELPPVTALSELLVNGGSMRSVRSNQRKILRWSRRSIPILFRLDSDPAELWATALNAAGLDDLSAEDRVLLDLLSQAEAGRLPQAPPAVEMQELDPEVQQRLESLGYVGN